MKRFPGFLAVGFLAVSTLGVLPAAAQYYPAPGVYVPAPPPQAVLGPHHADAIVRSLGLRPLSRAQAHGQVFVVQALGQEGTQVQVTLDRVTGRVMQIIRVGRGAPRIASVPSGPAPLHELEDEGDVAVFEEDFPRPAGRGYPGYRDEAYIVPAPKGGPSVITRRGIEADDLPPPGQAPRDPGVTGSVPPPRGTAVITPDGYIGRAATQPPTVDPLVGVPKEFRGQQGRPAAPEGRQRTAARPPEPGVRSTPLPRPRPADVPAVAQREAPAAPAAKPEPKEPELSPAAREDAEKFPPVQPLE